MARAALVVALAAALAAHAAANVVVKIVHSEPECDGDPVSSTTSQVAVCPDGLGSKPKCKQDGDLSISERCITAPAFASPWTSLVPAEMVGTEGADLTFVPDACGKVTAVTVSESGSACTNVGGDAVSIFCKGSDLYHVSFVNYDECKAVPGVKIKSEQVSCKAAGKPAGFCVNAAVPPGCKGDFIAVNPERSVVSCWGGGPAGKTTTVTSVELPTEVTAAAAIAANAAETAAAEKTVAAMKAAEAAAPAAKSGAAAAAVTVGAVVAAAAAMLMA